MKRKLTPAIVCRVLTAASFVLWRNDNSFTRESPVGLRPRRSIYAAGSGTLGRGKDTHSREAKLKIDATVEGLDASWVGCVAGVSID